VIIKSKKLGVLGIPAGKDLTITVLPGTDEVADEIWNLARRNVLTKIDAGEIEELYKVELDEKEAKKGIVIGKLFGDLDAIQQDAVVKECLNVKTLNRWIDGTVSIKDSTRSTVKNQIDKMLDRTPPTK